MFHLNSLELLQGDRQTVIQQRRLTSDELLPFNTMIHVVPIYSYMNPGNFSKGISSPFIFLRGWGARTPPPFYNILRLQNKYCIFICKLCPGFHMIRSICTGVLLFLLYKLWDRKREGGGRVNGGHEEISKRQFRLVFSCLIFRR